MIRVLVTLAFTISLSATAQTADKPAAPKDCPGTPQVSGVLEQGGWTFSEREVVIDADCLLKNGTSTKGVLWLNSPGFGDGTIELDIKGKNDQGNSFLGVAFHGLGDARHEVVYFRPFNFNNPERRNRSVQYMSLPEYEWFTLREKWPGKYESAPHPVPDPDAWFRVKIEVKYPKVAVYVNGNAAPSLVVSQLSQTRKGMVGLWTGKNASYFRNIVIRPAAQ